MANNEQIKVLVSTSDSIKSLADLKQHIRECKDALVTLEEGTDEYNKVALECAESMHKLTEITEQTRNASSDFGDRLSNVTGTIQGMAGAVQATIGGLSLMGVNIGDDIKVMKMLQSAMSLTNGIAQIDNGIKAFGRLKNSISGVTKGMGKFKIALISTGLGALVVVLGTIIANWEEFTKQIGLSSEQLNKLRDVWNGVMNVIKSGLKGIVSALIKIVKGDFKGAWEELKSGFDVVANYQQGVAEGVTKREQAELEKRIAKQKEYADKRKEMLDELYSEQDKRYSLEQKKLENQRNQNLISESEYFEKRKKLINDYYDLVSKRGDTSEIQSQLADLTGEIIAIDKQITDAKIKAEQERQTKLKQDTKNAVSDNTNDEEIRYAIEKQKLLLAIDEETNLKRLELEQEHNQRKLEIENVNFELQKETLEQGSQELLDLERQHNLNVANLNLESVQIEKQIADEKVKIKQQEIESKKKLENAYLKFSQSILGDMGTIFGALAEMNAENFEQQKRFKIAEAVTSTISSGISAVASIWADSTIPSVVAKGILTATTVAGLLASGYAQIEQIRKTTADSSNAGSSSPTSANINYGAVTNLTTNIQNTRQTTTATDEESMPEQRVYVVESDITEMQNSTRAKIRNATY